MSDVGGMVAELIAAGCSPEVAAQVVARAFVAGANSANFRGIPPDAAAEKRRAYDRERKRKSTGIPPESTGIPKPALVEDNEDKKVSRRGSRLPPEWQLPPEGREFARKRGWSDAQIDEVAGSFRDYWVAKPGAGGLKLDWLLTWQKWVRDSNVKPAKQVSSIVQPLDRNWDVAAKLWLKFRTWPTGYGPDPDSPACQCPREILEKHRGAA